jgi:hypothetical protein
MVQINIDGNVNFNYCANVFNEDTVDANVLARAVLQDDEKQGRQVSC